MTREEFIKIKWKAYHPVFLKLRNETIECLVCSVNFDTELVELETLDPEYVKKVFPAHIKFIELKKSRLHFED